MEKEADEVDKEDEDEEEGEGKKRGRTAMDKYRPERRRDRRRERNDGRQGSGFWMQLECDYRSGSAKANGRLL